jgi:transposase
MANEDEKLRVKLVGRDGRRSFDRLSKARLIESCLQPGTSVAQLALDHGINANLLWKWIRQHRQAKQEALLSSPASLAAFIPVQIGSPEVVSRPDDCRALDRGPDRASVRLSEPVGTGQLSSPARMSASLPNGVKVTLECCDAHAVTAMIGALCNVQTGR